MPTNHFQSHKGTIHLHPLKIGGGINIKQPIDNSINAMPPGMAGMASLGISPQGNVTPTGNTLYPIITKGGSLAYGLKHLNFKNNSKDNKNIKFRIK